MLTHLHAFWPKPMLDMHFWTHERLSQLSSTRDLLQQRSRKLRQIFRCSLHLADTSLRRPRRCFRRASATSFPQNLTTILVCWDNYSVSVSHSFSHSLIASVSVSVSVIFCQPHLGDFSRWTDRLVQSRPLFLHISGSSGVLEGLLP
ncbi:hypothetical protein ABBQ38_003421 [Trebouxia sp. C0009 RCD-2024]